MYITTKYEVLLYLSIQKSYISDVTEAPIY